MHLRKSAADLMSDTVETAEEKTSVSEVVKAMSKKDVGAVVVLNPSKNPVGIFTERDLLKRVISAGLDPETTPLSKVMTSKFVCAQADDDIEELVEIMIHGNFRHLPVADGAKLIGMLSLKDLAKHIVGMP